MVLTCRKFAELALPFLFQVPDTLASESTSKSNLTLTTLNLLSTLALPIPKLENSNARSHGELVRFLSLGRAPALDYKKILHDCPNVTHLMCFVTRSSRDWLPVLSHMKSLVALRIAAFEPLCAVNDHSVVTFPNLETLGLQIQHDRAWGTDHWDLPRLRRLSLMCRESRDKTRISRFLEQHHRTLEFLYCDPVLEDPTLTSAEDFFPRLTHLQIYHPAVPSPIEPAVFYRRITTITFPCMRWKDLVGLRISDFSRETLEDLHPVLFPSLKQIQCTWKLSGLGTDPLPPNLSSKIRPWFLDLLAEWERNGIEFIRTDTGEAITLSNLKL